VDGEAQITVMKIVVIGAGAMGSLWGARLSPLTEVWLLDRWVEHVAAMRKEGVHLIEVDGRVEVIPVRATTDPVEVGQGVDLAIIFVKSPGTTFASRLATTLLKPEGLALSLQNGLGNIEIMADVLGEARVVQGVTSHGATLLGPGRVRHAGVGATYLATRPEIAARVQRISELFTQAGFETHLSDDLVSLLWGKLIINAGINALTAILRLPNGVLAEVEPAGDLMAAAVAEAVRVAQAKNITLPYDDPQAQVKQVALATGANHSSMLTDVIRAAPTEIEFINGAIVREGQQLGLDTPVNQMLVWLVKAIEATYGERL
jgi:2-dehydropantoate 2-reductase